MGPQIDRVAPKMFIVQCDGKAFSGSGLLMHFAHPSIHFWYSFGSNQLPCPPLWIAFSTFPLPLAPSFKPNAVPTSVWLLVSVCSARFQGVGVCQCRCPKNINIYAYILYIVIHAPYWGVGG